MANGYQKETQRRNPKTGKPETVEQQMARIALHEKASEAWGRAWDEARDADVKAGRRYDRGIYAEKAHEASVAVLGVCTHRICALHGKAVQS